LELSGILLIGCAQGCLGLREKAKHNACFQATTLEEALLILQEHPDILVVVVDCRSNSVERLTDTARVLRQEGFLNWMIAVCTRGDTKRQMVKTEYDLSCSEDEVCDIVSSLV